MTLREYLAEWEIQHKDHIRLAEEKLPEGLDYQYFELVRLSRAFREDCEYLLSCFVTQPFVREFIFDPITNSPYRPAAFFAKWGVYFPWGVRFDRHPSYLAAISAIYPFGIIGKPDVTRILREAELWDMLPDAPVPMGMTGEIWKPGCLRLTISEWIPLEVCRAEIEREIKQIVASRTGIDLDWEGRTLIIRSSGLCKRPNNDVIREISLAIVKGYKVGVKFERPKIRTSYNGYNPFQRKLKAYNRYHDEPKPTLENLCEEFGGAESITAQAISSWINDIENFIKKIERSAELRSRI